MKQLIGVVIVLLFFLAGCAGHGPSEPMKPPSVEEHLRELESVLDLSAAQVEKIRPVLENHHAEMIAMFERAHDGGQSAMMDLRDEIKLQNDILHDALEKYLTPQQLEKYDQYMKKKEERDRDHMQGPGGPGGPGGPR